MVSGLKSVGSITPLGSGSSALEGTVRWSPFKSLWASAMYTVAILGGALTASWENAAVFALSSAITLCFGHSLGMHRLLIHRSYACPKWLEYCLVHLGVLVGLAGPIGMTRTHDLRDWAQRQPQSHPYFCHDSPIFKDWWWQLHCDIALDRPPNFTPPDGLADDRVYAWMERWWVLQQLPLAALLYFAGGTDWLIWGLAVRVAVSLTGHWLIGFIAHNRGHRRWHIEGASQQGYNVPFCGLITFGECWHNNHHAFPGSARLGLEPGQMDPGWQVLMIMEKLGLAWDFRLPADLEERPELLAL